MFNPFKLYNAVKPKYRKRRNYYLRHLLGKPGEEAIVEEIIEGPYKSGRVKFRGSWWPAKCERSLTLNPGQRVLVKGIHNITLLVEPVVSNSIK